MAINYPTSLDTFTNPTATSLLTSPSHAQQHSDINDAVEALQTKVAIGNTVLGTYTAYTPTMSNFTLGNGTVSSSYCRVNNFVHYFGKVTLGSTSVVLGGGQALSVPINIDSTQTSFYNVIGSASYYDISAVAGYPGVVNCVGSATTVYLQQQNSAGTYLTAQAVVSTIPFTWAVNDTMNWNVFYKAA